VYVGDRFFALERFPDDEDGLRRIEVLTQHPRHPQHPFFLTGTGRPLREDQRYEVFPDVFITVRDASEQSRVKVTIEAPRKMRIGSTPVTPANESPASPTPGAVCPAPLRQVQLPPSTTGALYLHRLPGRPPEPLTTTLNAIARLAITRVVCLVPATELAGKSPDYARFLAQGNPPWIHHVLPIRDFGIPHKATEFWDLAQAMADFVQLEGRVLLHCASGIGRTGMFATAVLMRLGLLLPDAFHLVAQAGSGPETSAQRALLRAGGPV
jgi:protein-tyrosine phosphatase